MPPSGCESVLQLPIAANNPIQVWLCAPGAGFEPFWISGGADVTPSRDPLRLGSPHIAVASVTAANPMTLTLGETPYPLAMAAGNTITIRGASCPGLDGNHTITTVSDKTLTIDYNGSDCQSYVSNSADAYSQDFVFRLHRDRALNQEIAEAWNVDGTGYRSQAVTLVSAPDLTLPAKLGIGPTHARFGFVRWYAGAIGMNAKAPFGGSATAGEVIADWEFNGNGDDGSGHGLHLSFTVPPVYSAKPQYPPACNAGLQQSWRAGTSATLDGSRSFALDGGNSLSFVWRQIPSDELGTPQQRLRWSAHNIATPTVTRFVAGPLNFRLTVTDESGATSSCTVHHGAVATDDAGNVAIADPKVAQIIGPLLQWGHPNQPWRHMDELQKQWADLLGPMQGRLNAGKINADRTDAWNVRAAGTVAVKNGDWRIYGTGTAFQAALCNRGKWPVLSLSDPSPTNIVIWYPNANIPGGQGRRTVTVGKCVSETVVDLVTQWSDDDRSSANAYQLDAPPTFSYTAGKALVWRPGVSCAGGSTNVNVNGLGDVRLKRADGISDPLPSDCAQSQEINKGVSLSYDGTVMRITGPYTLTSYSSWHATPGTTTGMPYSAWLPTSYGSWINGSASINFYDSVLAYYSLYYRTGIDTYLGYARWLADKWWSMPYYDSGYSQEDNVNPLTPRVEALTGVFLRAIDQDNLAGAPGSSTIWPGLRRLIDMGPRYVMNATSKSRALLGDIRETAYNDMWVALCAAYDPDPAHATACRADIHDSIVATWQAQRQPAGFWQSIAGSYTSAPATFYPVSIVPGTVSVSPGSNIITIEGGNWSASQFPAHFFSVGNVFDPATRDSGYYDATYVDAMHIRLSRPYYDSCSPGCSGRQWFIGPTWVGFGVQPFMLGILGQFFNQASIALSMDPQYSDTAALAKSYVVDVAKWITSAGTRADWRGLWYGVGYGICAGATPDPSCYSPDILQSRELNPEVLGTIALAYSYSPSPKLLAVIDNLYSAVFAKYPQDPGYDGTYASDMDGFNLGTANPKWHGFYWGMGHNAAWPSVRQGGLLPERPAVVYIEMALGKLAEGGHMRVTVTDATGFVRPPVICNASPCAVTVNRTLGNALVEITEVSAQGIATGEPIIVQVK